MAEIGEGLIDPPAGGGLGATVRILAASYTFGAVNAALGRSIGGGAEWLLPGLPPGMDLMGNGKYLFHPIGFAYGAGVATAHLDRIINTTADYFL
ncbi:hypothetical protein GOV07_03980 [Candidatus Woesearchaeota archaeon]|nr:hypothetical protein [Candidatus Woesearchaeota archaeon]